MPALFWLIAAILIILFIASPFLHQNSQGLSTSSRRRSYEQADQLIRTAGSEQLRGLNDQAYSHFRQARELASAAQLYFLEAEANYGMAEICLRKQDLPSAAQCLRNLLATRAHWEQEEPGYAQLAQSKLTEVEAQIAAAKIELD